MKNRHFHYTDLLLSLYQNNSNKCFSHVYRPLLLGAVFFFSLQLSAATINIAVIDTGFCPKAIKSKHTSLTIHDPLDMTGTNNYDCSKINSKELHTSPRFHGQHVLNEFISFLPHHFSASIRPLIVYDKAGNQTAEAWKKSLQYIEANKIDYVLTASGFITDEKLSTKLQAIWFAPSGRAEKKITQKTQLYPQNLAPLDNLFLIGDYFDGRLNFYDQALLYKDKIDYHLPSGKKYFIGTSRAVAEALARALKLCHKSDEAPKAQTFRQCLKKSEITLTDPVLKKEFKSF